MNKKRIRGIDIVLFLLCLVFAVGMLTFLKTCGAKEDGSFMNCQWAWRAVTGISVLLFLILNGSKSFNFLIAGWEIRLRLRNLTDFMVFFVAFTLVSLILSIIAWVKYNKTSATPPRTGTATP